MENSEQQLDLSIDEYQKNSHFLQSNPEMGLEGIDQERYYYFVNNIVNSIKEQGYLIYNQDELKKKIFVELDKVLFGREDNTFHTKPNLTAPAYATVSDLQRESEVRNQADTRITNSLSVFLGQYNTDAANNINKFNLKQDKTDNNLATTDKTVVGAINEVKSSATPDLTPYQTKSDNGLATNDKTVVGAINELKGGGSDLSNYYNKSETNDLLNTKQNTLTNGNYTTVNNNKIDVTDDTLGTQINTVQNDYGLLTSAQTVKGAIGELVDNLAITTTQVFSNTNSIDTKQNINEPTLNTTNKTIPGGINEVLQDINGLATTVANKQDVLATTGQYTTISGNQVNVTSGPLGTQINTVQNNYTLATTAQTVKGAIGELLSDINTVTSSVGGKQNTLVNGSYTNVNGNQVNVNDTALGTQINTVQTGYGLATTTQTIKGAINELVGVNNTQNTNINQNATNVTALNTSKQNTLVNGSYTTVSGNQVNVTSDPLGTQVNTVQNNYGLTTTAQTIKGAVGELLTNINTVSSSLTTKQNILINGNYTTVSGNQVNVTDDALGVQINTVQSDYNLLTNAQTIVGAINEVSQHVYPWETVSTNGNTIYVGSSGSSGVYRSTDGLKFTGMTGTSGTIYVVAISTSSTNGGIYAGSSNGTLYRSTDGLKFTTLASVSPSSGIFSIAIDAGGTVYVGTSGGTVYKLSGTTFTAISGTVASVNMLMIISNNIYATCGGTSSTSSGGVYKSINGNAFTAMTGVSISVQKMAVSATGVIYACGVKNSIYKSTDDKTFTLVTTLSSSSTSTVYSIAIDPNNGTIYAGSTDGKVYKSTDGTTFTAMTGTSGTIYSILVDQNSFIYATSSNGTVYKSINASTFTSMTGAGGTIYSVVYGAAIKNWKKISYSLIPGKNYKVHYNWDGDNANANPTNNNQIIREFTYNGGVSNIETFSDTSSAIQQLQINSTGVQIFTRTGTSTIGNLFSLEENQD